MSKLTPQELPAENLGDITKPGRGAGLAGLSHNISLLLVQLGVQYVVFNTAQLKHPAQ